MFFNRVKISMKKIKIKNTFKYYVDFGRIKNKKEFKAKLVTVLFPDNFILGIIDTGMMYSPTDNDKLSQLVKVFCEKYSTEYKCIKVKKEEKGIFGAKIKIGEESGGFDYIFGLLLDSNKISSLSDIINEYNSAFYAAKNPEILRELDLDYSNMKSDMYVFIDNFMDRAAISSKTDKPEAVLERLRNEFNK